MRSSSRIETTILTGGFDRPYAYGLTKALLGQGIALEVIGSDELDSDELRSLANLRFLNFYGDRSPRASRAQKVSRVLAFYAQLVKYVAKAKPRIFHILWNSKFQYFDRTLLMLYYKLLGKRLVFTAHNVNAGKRDGQDSVLNRLTLQAQYRLVDHIFVHTAKMKDELKADFRVRDDKVTIIPFGINDSVPDTAMTSGDAKRKLGLRNDEKAILFYGAIRPYKGLEYLVAALQQLKGKQNNYRLMIAGEPKRGAEEYWRQIQQNIANDSNLSETIQRIEFVPDAETELYFKAADVTVLPYTLVFQSGVLFLAYTFGLPAIASDVGSFRDDILEGQTGTVFREGDSSDLAQAIERYFASDLYKELEQRRRQIKSFATEKNSWEVVGKLTQSVYQKLLEDSR
jgi:D-inositol-3-phosphate glycosyltransferase